MAPAVLGASIVSDVDIVAEIRKLDWHGGARIIIGHAAHLEETGAILRGTMLEQNRALST